MAGSTITHPSSPALGGLPTVELVAGPDIGPAPTTIEDHSTGPTDGRETLFAWANQKVTSGVTGDVRGNMCICTFVLATGRAQNGWEGLKRRGARIG